MKYTCSRVLVASTYVRCSQCKSRLHTPTPPPPPPPARPLAVANRFTSGAPNTLAITHDSHYVWATIDNGESGCRVAVLLQFTWPRPQQRAAEWSPQRTYKPTCLQTHVLTGILYKCKVSGPNARPEWVQTTC